MIAGEETRGGVAVLIRNNLKSFLYKVEIDRDLICFSLKMAPAITFITAYIPPRDSPFFSLSTFSAINEICRRSSDRVVLLGDLNARMNEFRTHFNDQKKNVRYEMNVDPVTNANGHDLIALLKKNKLMPLNHLM